MRNFGITLDQYYKLLAEQEGKCRLCGEPFGESRGRKPALDHDHETGNVRGILHCNCNIGIGMLQDSPELCMKAATYLRMTKDGKKGTLLQVIGGPAAGPFKAG